MNDFYKSLKRKMQKNEDSIPPLRVNSAAASSLNRDLEGLEQFFADRIGRLKEAVNSGEAIVIEEARQAEQRADNLEAENAALNDALDEARKASERKDLAYAKIEENLSVKIGNLQDELKKREEVLAARESETNEFKAKMDESVKRIGELELAQANIKEQAARHAKRADDLAKSSWEKITALELRLDQAENVTQQKQAVIENLEQQLAGSMELEQQLTAQTRELEKVLENKDGLLRQRDAEIIDLRAQLKRFKKGIHEISYLFREAEALSGFEEQDLDATAENEFSESAETRARTMQSISKITANVMVAGTPDFVPPEIFDRIISELSQAINVIPAVASVIVHQQAKSLGESVERFPRARVPELLQGLAQEITDEELQLDFYERFANLTLRLN